MAPPPSHRLLMDPSSLIPDRDRRRCACNVACRHTLAVSSTITRRPPKLNMSAANALSGRTRPCTKQDKGEAPMTERRRPYVVHHSRFTRMEVQAIHQTYGPNMSRPTVPSPLNCSANKASGREREGKETLNSLRLSSSLDQHLSLQSERIHSAFTQVFSRGALGQSCSFHSYPASCKPQMPCVNYEG